MKRVLEACVCQTLCFTVKEDVGHDEAVKLVRMEIERYKTSLEKSKTVYKILEETEQPDGSVILKLKKQHNYSPVGSYLD